MYEELTAFIPKLQDSRYGEWIIDTENDGTFEHPLHLPYVAYDNIVDEFLDAVDHFKEHHSEMELTCYKAILEKANIQWNEESMKAADVSSLNGQTVMAMIVGIIRAERFCDGAIFEALKNGSIIKWLKRLKEIDDRKNIVD